MFFEKRHKDIHLNKYIRTHYSKSVYPELPTVKLKVSTINIIYWKSIKYIKKFIKKAPDKQVKKEEINLNKYAFKPPEVF